MNDFEDKVMQNEQKPTKKEHIPEPSDGLIVVRNLVKQFGERVVLEDISLAIEKGKTTVIIGPSGCGKTQLIKHFIVLTRPTQGEVYFNSQRIDGLPEAQLDAVRMHFGFLFQEGALFDSLTVSENILFPVRQHYNVTPKDNIDELVQMKLAMVGLDGYQNYYPSKLSGGQRKRVALARAIALNPDVILYDEPTTGLDPIRSDIINELILKLQRELKLTSIVVTHDMTSAYKIADRIVMLHYGKIIADGSPEHIRNHPNQLVQQFVNGQVNDDELAVLRATTSRYHAQFLPRDFEE